MCRSPRFWLFLIVLLSPLALCAQLAPDAAEKPSIVDSMLNSPNPFEQRDYLNLHSQLRILGFLTLLAMIPTVVIMMTSFTRITIIFHFLRQALATQHVPSNQIVIGLSLILTVFIMQPVIQTIQEDAITPYFNNEFQDLPEVKMGMIGEDRLFLERTWAPMRSFLLHHTREKDLELFLELGRIELPVVLPEDMKAHEHTGIESAYDLDAIPWYCLTPAFVLSELRVAFMMGFLLFMPFLVIDMIIASILMSMGMMMLPPVMISMPFKLLLFILIDGWRLIIMQTVNSFFPVG
jgi:flagellar biosynthetic protein FliP